MTQAIGLRFQKRSREKERRQWIFLIALSIVGDHELAEDITQEVTLKAKHMASDIECPEAWLRKVTVNHALNALRKAKPEPLSAEAPAKNPDVDARLQVESVLRRLSPEHRAILALAFRDQLSYREMSEALEIPEGTVASRLAAAKQAFQVEWDR